MGNILSSVVFFSSVALALCLWNDSEYTQKAGAILIFAYISFLIENEYQKNNEN